MKAYYYVGLDIHKKTVSFCVKQADGTIIQEGVVGATRERLVAWQNALPGPWKGAMEATLFTGWIYDLLKPYADELKVGNPRRLEAIASAKKKNDRIDARTLADLLRCNLLPECYMAPPQVRELRRVLRYRNLLVREAVRMKNKAATLLMEVGAEYSKDRLHQKRYFEELVGRLEDVPPSVIHLLGLTRSSLEMFLQCQQRLLNALRTHPDLRERVERLMTIQGVGEVTALTWTLEIGEPGRFSSIRKAISYCGLCSAQRESADKSKRGPLSKQRNEHLQTVLIEAAKLAPRWNPRLAHLYDEQKRRGANCNRATLAVARKLVAYLLAVDRSGNAFVPAAA